METFHSKKFVMSYSCGKDSTLALHKMIRQGNEPVALLIMINEDLHRSFFHGADAALLKKYADALQIPFLFVPTSGAEYHLSMEAALRLAKAKGAEAVCFGDIDIENNRRWGEERCRSVQLEAIYPLWQHDRSENVRELLALGYRCLIKSINHTLLPKTLLGKLLDEDAVREMERCGIDICGENGEYHTLVVDGPIFHKPLSYKTGNILDFGDYSVIEVD